MITTTFNVAGLDNTNSALEIKNAIISLSGVSNVAIDVNTAKVSITYDPNSTNINQIRNKIAITGHYIQ